MNSPNRDCIQELFLQASKVLELLALVPAQKQVQPTFTKELSESRELLVSTRSRMEKLDKVNPSRTHSAYEHKKLIVIMKGYQNFSAVEKWASRFVGRRVGPSSRLKLLKSIELTSLKLYNRSLRDVIDDFEYHIEILHEWGLLELTEVVSTQDMQQMITVDQEFTLPFADESTFRSKNQQGNEHQGVGAETLNEAAPTSNFTGDHIHSHIWQNGLYQTHSSGLRSLHWEDELARTRVYQLRKLDSRGHSSEEAEFATIFREGDSYLTIQISMGPSYRTGAT